MYVIVLDVIIYVQFLYEFSCLLHRRLLIKVSLHQLDHITSGCVGVNQRHWPTKTNISFFTHMASIQWDSRSQKIK